MVCFNIIAKFQSEYSPKLDYSGVLTKFKSSYNEYLKYYKLSKYPRHYKDAMTATKLLISS